LANSGYISDDVGEIRTTVSGKLLYLLQGLARATVEEVRCVDLAQEPSSEWPMTLLGARNRRLRISLPNPLSAPLPNQILETRSQNSAGLVRDSSEFHVSVSFVEVPVAMRHAFLLAGNP
jgi:hypothetical protein